MTKLIALDLRSNIPNPIPDLDVAGIGDDLSFNSGDSLADRWSPIDLRISDDRDSPRGLTDLMQTVRFWVVSKRLADVLQHGGCRCEFLPLVAYYHDERLDNSYFALNVLNVVDDSLDLERSIIGFYDQDVRMAFDVEKVVLKTGAWQETAMSYLLQLDRVAVNARIASDISQANLLGISLIDPSEFTS